MTETPLGLEQRQRVAALHAAKLVLTRPGVAAPSSKPDAVDLHSLAYFIMTGRDPWNDPASPPRIRRATEQGWLHSTAAREAREARQATGS